jgi:GrpB-like predicted nucleotidyltransferase (UPF0157 family)
MVAAEVRDRGPKPLDVGNGRVCASFAADGSWLSLGCVHPRHGFVELTGAPPFDEAWRGRPEAVRRYRDQLALAGHAAVRLTGAVPEVVPHPSPPGRARWSGVDGAGRYEAEAWAPAGHRSVVQRHRWRAGPDLRPRELALVVSARIQRPPFAEITEVSPLPPLASRASITAEGTVLRVVEPVLPAAARLRVDVAGGTTGRWRIDADAARLPISWDPRRAATLEVEVTCALAPDDPPVPGAAGLPGRDPGARGHPAGPLTTRLHVPARLRPALSRLIDGALGYVLGCTALTVASGERCILTDHRLLQLSWTRDAYYQALLLLAARHLEPRGLTVVADHLRWLWVRCDRGANGWARSHLPNGAVKDRAFQADQQLYPVLELLDYRELAGAWPESPPGRAGWGELVAEAWRALPVDAELGLLAGEENPADDPASLPFLLSTQVLLWHTATRLRAHAGELGLDAPAFAGAAATVRAAIRDRFACPGPFGTQWAYETDGRGRHRRYHDANDLPTALAPLWGLCPPEDPEWSATMRFAFDRANPAWSAGRWGGLGSAHTPGSWPLGDVQEWVVASLSGETGRAGRVLERLLAVAAPDGLLPETYDSDTGTWAARHWFAWPSAVLAALALGVADPAEQEVRPSSRPATPTAPSRIEVVAYDPAWPERFAELGRELRAGLGEVALRIDHIGATSVAGLAAKPIIDIQVSVADFEPLEAFKQPLERLGYTYRADNPERTKRYFREPPGRSRTHVHVRRAGSFSEQWALLFRDYLRAHPEVAAEYGALKRRLASRHRDDRRAYTAAKEPFSWELIRRADGWAQAQGWQPGPSDA